MDFSIQTGTPEMSFVPEEQMLEDARKLLNEFAEDYDRMAK